MLKKIIVTIDINVPKDYEDCLAVKNIRHAFYQFRDKLKLTFPKTTMVIEGVDEHGQKSIEG